MMDGPQVIREAIGPSNGVNFIREAITELKEELTKCPKSEVALTSREYLRWSRRSLIKLGAALGKLSYAQAAGHITPEAYKTIHMELLGLTTRVMAAASMKGF
jgi:hypothetical protein